MSFYYRIAAMIASLVGVTRDHTPSLIFAIVLVGASIASAIEGARR